MTRIKPGYGYWDTTHYPIGGSFRRAPKPLGVEVEITDTIEPFKGCDTLVRLKDGSTAAVDSAHLEKRS